MIKGMVCKVDLHVHSWYSGDSDGDPEEMILRAIEGGLHGIVFTEHYSYEASEPVEALGERYRDEIVVLRGVEFSAAEGHCLVFGVNTDRLSMKDAPIEEVIEVVNRVGGTVVPSHPYRGMNSVGDVIKGVRGICAIEGYNGCNRHFSNLKALEAAAALGLPCTGGSDAHHPREVGLCYTEFNDRVTADNFIDLLRAGSYQAVDARKISRAWTF